MKKQDYINAFLEGYFSDKKVEYGMQYYSMLNEAIDKAEKKWKKYKPKKHIHSYKRTYSYPRVFSSLKCNKCGKIKPKY